MGGAVFSFFGQAFNSIKDVGESIVKSVTSIWSKIGQMGLKLAEGDFKALGKLATEIGEEG